MLASLARFSPARHARFALVRTVFVPDPVEARFEAGEGVRGGFGCCFSGCFSGCRGRHIGASRVLCMNEAIAGRDVGSSWGLCVNEAMEGARWGEEGMRASYIFCCWDR